MVVVRAFENLPLNENEGAVPVCARRFGCTCTTCAQVGRWVILWQQWGGLGVSRVYHEVRVQKSWCPPYTKNGNFKINNSQLYLYKNT